jgi:hypothetical protein
MSAPNGSPPGDRIHPSSTREFHMGLFDTIREKAAELLSGVTENAGDLADGLPGELPGAETLNDLSQSATDAASEATNEAAGTVQDLSADATEAATDAAGSVTDATDTVTGSVTDATGEPPQRS